MQELVPRKYIEFRELIFDLLEWSPSRRPKPRDALKHPFFRVTL